MQIRTSNMDNESRTRTWWRNSGVITHSQSGLHVGAITHTIYKGQKVHYIFQIRLRLLTVHFLSEIRQEFDVHFIINVMKCDTNNSRCECLEVIVQHNVTLMVSLVVRAHPAQCQLSPTHFISLHK